MCLSLTVDCVGQLIVFTHSLDDHTLVSEVRGQEEDAIDLLMERSHTTSFRVVQTT